MALGYTWRKPGGTNALESPPPDLPVISMTVDPKTLGKKTFERGLATWMRQNFLKRCVRPEESE